MADETNEQGEQNIDPEPETEVTEPERSPLADQIEATFKMKYDAATPEQREAMYQALMRTQANRPEPPAQKTEHETLEFKNLEAISQMNRQQLLQAAQAAITDGDPEALADVMDKFAGAIKDLPAWFNKAYDRLGNDVTSMRMRQDLVEARSGVKGATAADIPLATQLLTEGRATTAEDALRLVVFDRLTTTPKRSVDDTARRTARAVAANAAAKGGDPDGYPAQKFPQTVDEEEALKLKEYEAGELVT